MHEISHEVLHRAERRTLTTKQIGETEAEARKSQGVELNYSARIAPTKGLPYGDKITLLPGQSSAEEFATLAHELAHEMLYRG